MPPGKRHFSRASIYTRLQSSGNSTVATDDSQRIRKICPSCVNEGLGDLIPVHIPVPRYSSWNSFLIEFFIAVFCLLFGGIQYYNIYESAWWLPHSYHHYGLNLHLIDWFIVQFIVVMILRPLIFGLVRHYGMKIVNRFDNYPSLGPCIRIILSFLFVGYGVACGMYVWWIYGFAMLMFMFLPWVLFMVVYNNKIREYFDLANVNFPSSGFNMEGLTHQCYTTSQKSREEAEYLRSDFNARAKYILCNSFTHSYYSVYIPVCFSQGFLFFDKQWISFYILLVSLTCFSVYLTHYFPFHYYDLCHRAALHLGRWSKVYGKVSPIYLWVDNTYWYKGLVVKHHGTLFRAEGLVNSAEPGDVVQEFFYSSFAKPGSLIYWCTGIKISILCFTLVFLSYSTQWNYAVASCLMLAFSCYFLYVSLREYGICVSFYAVEELFESQLGAS